MEGVKLYTPPQCQELGTIFIQEVINTETWCLQNSDVHFILKYHVEKHI